MTKAVDHLPGRIRISRPQSFLAVAVAPERLEGGCPTASGRATAFFWERAEQWYLITNIHVVTGWNHDTGTALSPTGFTPTHLSFELSIDIEEGDTAGELVQRKGYRIPLEEDGRPLWFEHPIHGPRVDVAAIPVFAAPCHETLSELGARRILNDPVNNHSDWVPFDVASGEDAFVLGYPKGMSTRGFPIWKRASIASEPDIDVDDLPKILVDTATREGMSGAPVVAVRRGITMPTGKFDAQTILGETMNFIGVYSGRIGEDELGVQLGIVWKESVINEIIDGCVRGKSPWASSAQSAP